MGPLQQRGPTVHGAQTTSSALASAAILSFEATPGSGRNSPFWYRMDDCLAAYGAVPAVFEFQLAPIIIRLLPGFQLGAGQVLAESEGARARRSNR